MRGGREEGKRKERGMNYLAPLSHYQCDYDVKNVPVVCPESPEVVQPPEQYLGHEVDYGEGINEPEELIQHYQPRMVREGQLWGEEGGEGREEGGRGERGRRGMK